MAANPKPPSDTREQTVARLIQERRMPTLKQILVAVVEANQEMKEQDPSQAPSLPVNAPDRLILRTRLQSTPAQINQAGLSGKVEKALLERNRRISQALKILNTYRVTHADLARVIDECVVRDEQ